VNLCNELATRNFDITLCATRHGGTLQKEISPGVHFVNLNRRSRFDFLAMIRLIRLVKADKIQIIHAHGTSLFIARIVKIFLPSLKIVWHVHHGAFENTLKIPLIYKIFTQYIDGVITVSQSLANWSIYQLHLPQKKVWYLPNFVPIENDGTIASLPGVQDQRIVCVANFRPEKDHLSLIQAMKIVHAQVPQAHLFLVGAATCPDIESQIKTEIEASNLESSITWLGPRTDVRNILRSCDIGVLSSVSEGLPLALLEYGTEGLAAVSTDVGQCVEVLGNGQWGILVPPKSPAVLAQAMVNLLQDKTCCDNLGNIFQYQIKQKYSQDAVMKELEIIYQTIMNPPRSKAGVKPTFDC